jgi:hypothetical protein
MGWMYVMPVTARDKVGLEWDINPSPMGYYRRKAIYDVLPDLRPAAPS